ncbi:MAG: DUF4126 domain-containing protein [Xanthomonadaceae bacterium]|nr:DUF4126 domain-containing protein [Xanthomonadaceae bacterium]
MSIDLVTSVMVGICLSAAAGFRVFLPMLATGLAGWSGHIALDPQFAWLQSELALAALATATLVEVAAYYLPVLDNALDSLSTPIAILAGTVLSAALLGELPPMLQWSLAVVLGGGTSATVQAGTVALRALSLGASGGLGNPVVSTGENAGGLLLVLLALFAPVLGAILLAGLIFLLVRLWRRRRGSTHPA